VCFAFWFFDCSAFPGLGLARGGGTGTIPAKWSARRSCRLNRKGWFGVDTLCSTLVDTSPQTRFWPSLRL
jgi:hypothetical protein